MKEEAKELWVWLGNEWLSSPSLLSMGIKEGLIGGIISGGLGFKSFPGGL